MRPNLFPSPLAVCLLLAAVVSLDQGPAQGGTPRPIRRPDSEEMNEESERENHEKREAWLEGLHRAAPGTDWRAIEAENRRAAILAREAELEGGTRSNLWEELGSRNQAGRTWVTVLDAANPGQILSGSDNGGLWRGGLDGTGWSPISDGIGRAGHHLVTVPGSPITIVTANDSEVHVSTNGGATWSVPGGLPDAIWSTINLVREFGSRRVYLLTEGWIGSTHAHFLHRSDDGGLTFTLRQTFPLSPRPDIWISRSAGGPLYLMQGKDCLRSTNFGASFVAVGSTPTFANRARLAGCEAGAPKFYAAVREGSQWKIYSSTNAGSTWNFRSNISDFYETLQCSITNTSLVFYGGVEAHRSTDGAGFFSTINLWWQYYDDPANKLHADIFGIDCAISGGGEKIFFDTDGGTYISSDGGASVSNLCLEGVGISQYYGILTSKNDPFLIAAGAQDQGYQVSQPGMGTPYMDFVQSVSGDYGHLSSSDGSLNMVYSVYPGFTLLQEQEADPNSLFFVDWPAGSNGFQWMPFCQADPDDPDVYYLAGSHLWRCQRVSGETYSNTELPQNFAVSGASYVAAFGMSPADHQRWYVVTNNGRFWSSTDAGGSWSLSPDIGPESHYFYGTAILPSPTDPLTCYAGGAGYSGPGVYKTTDGGAQWAPMSESLPSTLVFGLAFDNATDQNVYAATEAGPYAYRGSPSAWEYIGGTEAPITTYWDVEGVAELGIVRFASYGRGIWDYTIPGPASVDQLPMPSGATIRVHPNPTAGDATIEYALNSGEGPLRIELFDVMGRRLAIFREDPAPQGSGSFTVDLRAAASGPLAAGRYLARLSRGTAVAVERVQLLP